MKPQINTDINKHLSELCVCVCVRYVYIGIFIGQHSWYSALSSTINENDFIKETKQQMKGCYNSGEMINNSTLNHHSGT